MKRLITVILSGMLLISLTGITGCEHVSSYRAGILSESVTSKHGHIRFDFLNGRYVMKLRNREDGGKLEYDCRIGEGDVDVSVETDGRIKDLFTLSSDGAVRSDADIGKGTVYIFVDTKGDCEDGEFDFRIR